MIQINNQKNCLKKEGIFISLKLRYSDLGITMLDSLITFNHTTFFFIIIFFFIYDRNYNINSHTCIFEDPRD